MQIKHNLVKNILATIVGCILAVAILHILLRLYRPLQFRVRGDNLELPLNQKYVFNNDNVKGIDKLIFHTKNSLGFRGDPPPENFKDYLSIVTIGGSTTESVMISDGKTWPDILSTKLKENFNKLWLNNAGFDGHSTYGHIILLNNYIVNLKPKIILFLVGANDQNLTKENPFDKKFIQRHDMSLEFRIKSMIFSNEVFNYAYNLYRVYRSKQMGIAHETLNFSNFSDKIETSAQNAENLKASHKDYLNAYQSRLLSLIEICNSNSIEPVLITQPMVYGEATDPETGVNLGKVNVGGLDGKTTWEIVELYNDAVRTVDRDRRVMLIDLARMMPKNSKYYYDTYHYSNEGSQKVAELIYSQLAPYLQEKYPDYYSTKDTGLDR